MADPIAQVHRSSNFAPHGQFTTLCSGAGIRHDSCSKPKANELERNAHSLLASTQKPDWLTAISLWVRWSNTTYSPWDSVVSSLMRIFAYARSLTGSNLRKLPAGSFFRISNGECMYASRFAWCCKANWRREKGGHAKVRTRPARPATNPGSDNLLAGVWALVSWKYSLFGFQRSSDHAADRRAQAGQPTRYSAGLLGITTSGMGGAPVCSERAFSFFRWASSSQMLVRLMSTFIRLYQRQVRKRKG